MLSPPSMTVRKRFTVPLPPKVYTGSWGDHSGVIRCQLGEAARYDLSDEPEPRREAPAFDQPSKGTSVEKFREMVFSLLKVEGAEVWAEPKTHPELQPKLFCPLVQAGRAGESLRPGQSDPLRHGWQQRWTSVPARGPLHMGRPAEG